MKIGIIGYGMVGSALGTVFHTAGHSLHIFDKYKGLGNIEDTLVSDVIFVSVPTQTNNGVQDLSPLTDVLSQLSAKGYSKPILIKCTVLPGVCKAMSTTFPNLVLFHNPEFLTEKNAVSDFAKQSHIIVSGPKMQEYANQLHDMFNLALPNANLVLFESYASTEMGKYIHNVFLAAKVAFFNQIYQYCESRGINYSQAISVAKSQGGIGNTHTMVPGPDGSLGFGGACFPKDTEALLGTQLFGELSILNEAVAYNKKIRTEK